MRGFLVDLAKAAGRVAREHFAAVEAKDIHVKGKRDYVSHVDRMVEDVLIRRIRSRFPEHQVLGEESGGEGVHDAAGPLWVLDPIDGTTNFIRGIPHFAISIAFLEGGRVRHAMVHDPLREEFFQAEAEAGLLVNGKRAYVSGCPDLDHAVVASALPFRFPEALEDFARSFLAIQRRCDDQRRGGSAALDLAYVACGRLDAYYELGIHPWDTAAGELLVRSGGGQASDWRGETGGILGRRSIVAAATPALHGEILAQIANLLPWLERPPFSTHP